MKTVWESKQEAIQALYRDGDAALSVYDELKRQFDKMKLSDNAAYYFSAPGRIEICGNHTDHQLGNVLTCAIDRDIAAIASANNTGLIRVVSVGQKSFSVEVADTSIRNSEFNRSPGMVRGINAAFRSSAGRSGGTDICIISNVPTGSGISSSAAFETLIATVINTLYNNGAFSKSEIARMCQYSETTYFGKPCGLMDQCASAYGGCIGIDFGNGLSVSPVSVNCITDSYDVYVIHTGGSHAKLGRDYAAVVDEMRSAAGVFGKKYLSEVSEEEFMSRLNDVRSRVGDRAALRGMHYYSENRRAVSAVQALNDNDADAFLDIINASGDSSVLLLQNVYLDHIANKSVALSLALTKRFLSERSIKGACRIHGGGFLGTTLSFIPKEYSADYKQYMERVFGQGTADNARIREYGAIAVCPVGQ